MNTCDVSGWIQGEPELRVTKDGRRILNFEIACEDEQGPYVPVGFLLERSKGLQLHGGERVFVHGSLKYHCGRGLFLAATKIRVLNADDATSMIDNAERLTK